MLDRRTCAAALASLVLFACSSHDRGSGHAQRPAKPPAAPASAASGSKTDHKQFRSSEYGLRIDYPAAMTAHRDFSHGYLANDAWKTFAGPDSSGQPVLELVLSGSNDITAGALRIGVSDAPDEVRECTMPAQTPRPANTRHVQVNGAPFTYFEAGDAAMSHYLMVHSYRTVHAGRCYAIDLLVTGTRPQVYDPPATPPFSKQQAFGRLQRALQGFHFLQPQ